MPPLKFCANLSWLFTDLPEFTQRIYAAASAGFQAVEAAWLYDSDLQELQRVKNATGVDVVLINTPLGKTEGLLVQPASYYHVSVDSSPGYCTSYIHDTKEIHVFTFGRKLNLTLPICKHMPPTDPQECATIYSEH